jgi:hypothetical protein
MNNEKMKNDDYEQKSNDINDDNILKQIEFNYLSNSHHSLLQSNDPNINIKTSSIDDLTRTNQFLSSTFHSKDSALGLSDDNLNQIQSNELIIQEQHRISSLITLQDKSKFHLISFSTIRHIHFSFFFDLSYGSKVKYTVIQRFYYR